MNPYLTTDRATLYHARAEDVYPCLEGGSVSMVWSDGPYAMKKAAWDMMGVDGLADWYAPHVEAWGRICAPSATVYLWGTAEGWARLDPVMRAAGWTFRALIVWDKGFSKELIGAGSMQTWPDVTEVCGFYQRNAWEMDTCAGTMIADAAGRDDRNWIRDWLIAEWRDEADLGGRPAVLRPDGRPWRSHADRALGTNGIGGHYFNTALWSLPTWDAYQKLAAYAAQHGPPRERPYLVHPSVWPNGDLRASYDHLRASYDHLRASYDHLRAEYDHLRAEYDHLRAEYEDARVPFTCPVGVSNVWQHPQVGGKERLKIDGETHPCQKPLAFASRAVLASSRVGDTILDPFAGTNRIAVACRRLPEEERRHAIGIEMDQRWLDAIRPSLIADHAHTAHARQPSLFAPKAN